ncbi:MAG TPA: PEP-CTERM sorting domain-containing protein [Rhizomicrobium sp.]|jgi:hypothetical protein
MRNIFISATLVVAAMIASGSALAGAPQPVPEPVSMSLLAGGIVAIAAIRHMRRK